MRPLWIGPLQIAQPVLLAPMAGVTDLPFRRQAQAFGAPYVVSEMVASEELFAARRDVVRRAAGAGPIKPLVIQLAGREARWMKIGAELACAAGADVIDINMGCPAKQVTGALSGSALMRDPDHALGLIEACVAGASVPVTLKMRLGWDRSSLNAPKIARRAADAGVAMITVHGRTRCEFYTGAADWAAVRPTVEAAPVPVIVNGDIVTPADARRALALSGAAGVMMGRGAQGRPWAPAGMARALASGGEAIARPPLARIEASLLELLAESQSLYGAALGLKTARKHMAWTIDAALTAIPAPVRRAARSALCRLEDSAALQEALRALFAEAEMAERRAA